MTGDWHDETFRDLARFGLRVARRLFDARSEHQRVEVLETELLGRVLVVDGVFMTSERDERFYHELLVHPPLLSAPSIERVLVVGGGDGGTVREVLRHPGVREVQMVEIDPVVVEASRRFLPTIGTAWDDPRLEVRIGDGVAFAAAADPCSFDVVLLDGTDPVGPGEGLFGEPFYRDVHRVLRPGGVFGLQSESPFLMPRVFADIQATLARHFGRVSPYLGPVPLYAAGVWSFTWASDAGDPLQLDGPRLRAMRGACEVWAPDVHRAAFVLPPWVRALAPRAPGA